LLQRCIAIALSQQLLPDLLRNPHDFHPADLGTCQFQQRAGRFLGGLATGPREDDLVNHHRAVLALVDLQHDPLREKKTARNACSDTSVRSR
jgi:hypothetical protein